jgi:hypothetical protein
VSHVRAGHAHDEHVGRRATGLGPPPERDHRPVGRVGRAEILIETTPGRR